ncbi:B12-binding domain-containing radical SAM protein, partial [candidate division KSB1 bacterium]|nr:B12-binding domain-containing radical SAM protein [candidate division KSB1 bacterium]
MNILLVYPETPNTFWSFKGALKFISKKSSEPPLGLLTVAAMLPDDWQKKLVDLNVTDLKDDDLEWADYVFLSGMNVHTNSMKEVIRRSNDIGVKVVAGGPMATSDPQEFSGVDHFILNEAEITLPQFLDDLKIGNPKHVYRTDQFPDITQSPTPMWHLLNLKKYANLGIQYSRG